MLSLSFLLPRSSPPGWEESARLLVRLVGFMRRAGGVGVLWACSFGWHRQRGDRPPFLLSARGNGVLQEEGQGQHCPAGGIEDCKELEDYEVEQGRSDSITLPKSLPAVSATVCNHPGLPRHSVAATMMSRPRMRGVFHACANRAAASHPPGCAPRQPFSSRAVEWPRAVSCQRLGRQPLL